MLTDILKNKKCFKLVCGAGNEDAGEVEKLVALYSAAGANFFDLSAKYEIITAAKKGLERARITKDRYLCCSVGIKGDPHVNKAAINSEKCSGCGKCKEVCLQNAINFNGALANAPYFVNNLRCIGCGKCLKVCPNNALTLNSVPTDLNKVLPEVVTSCIDCIEYHALGADESEVLKNWEKINNSFNGILSICIDRSKLGNEGVINRLKKMLAQRKPYTTIIQADGCPMSGSNDDYKTTLQAVAMAEIIQNENLPVYMLISGGTNSKTKALADLCGIKPDGVAIGTYARKIVSKYIQREDFFGNKEIFEKALVIAKELVNSAI